MPSASGVTALERARFPLPLHSEESGDSKRGVTVTHLEASVEGEDLSTASLLAFAVLAAAGADLPDKLTRFPSVGKVTTHGRRCLIFLVFME